MNDTDIPVNMDISVTFNADMNPSTFTNMTFTVYSKHTGYLPGTLAYNNQTQTLIFKPVNKFAYGEMITVTITKDIESYGGNNIESPYIWSFTTEVIEGNGIYSYYSAFSVGNYPTSITSGDFDQDGDDDLAAANWNGRSVSVLINKGNGIFGPQTIYNISAAFDVTSADIDRDGDIDIAAASDARDQISILKNNGDGTFITGTTLPCGDNPASVFAADYNGDGHLDLATANVLSNDVSVLLNNGNGTFSGYQSYAVYSNPRNLYAADLDGDGDFDLITSHTDHDMISVLFNKGDGSYGSYTTYATDDGPSSVIAADLDQDTDMDLISSNVYHSDNVSVFLNNGDGTFADRNDYRAGLDPRTVSAGDFDNDGDLDLATCGGYGKFVSIIFNDSHGVFTNPVSSLEGYRPFDMISLDIDKDGDLDHAGVISGLDSLCIIYHGDTPGAIPEIMYAPAKYELDQNHPNPFNPQTVISFTLPQKDHVKLEVFNTRGQRVAMLLDSRESAGYQEITFDGSQLASGIYFYQLITANGFSQIKKMILIR